MKNVYLGFVALSTTAVFALASVKKLASDKTSPNPTPTNTPFVNLSVDDRGLSTCSVYMKTTQGDIVYKFYSKDAPKTVQRMVELIQKGFYNGLSFHRYVENFVIQGGDPTGTGAGGSGKKLEAEFNQRLHELGTVAMARASDPNSADSQFYFTLDRHPHLDGQYTVFGKIVEGINVAKKLREGDKMLQVSIK